MPAKEPAIKSDLDRIDKLRDEDIDYGDIPDLGDDMFAKPLAPWPPKKETITIRVDSDVLGWFKRQGTGYQTRMNQVLRRYMDVAGQQRVRPAGRVRRQVSGRPKPSSKRARGVFSKRATSPATRLLGNDSKRNETAFGVDSRQLDEVITRREWRERQLGRDPLRAVDILAPCNRDRHRNRLSCSIEQASGRGARRLG